MGRIILGSLLALWGTAAAVYGLMQPLHNSVDAAAQIAVIVVAVCMFIGGISLIVTRKTQSGPRRHREREIRDFRGIRTSRRPSSGGVPVVAGVVITLLLTFAVTIGLAVSQTAKRKQNQTTTAQRNQNNGNTQAASENTTTELPLHTPPIPNPPAVPFNPVNPQPDQPQPPQQANLTPGLRETKPSGGVLARKEYREYRNDGAILVGFDVGLGKIFKTDIITYLRPIWLTDNGEEYGTPYGRTANTVVTVKARDGYAIGGVVVAGGGALEGICFTFMRRGEMSLIADDAYTSEWYGEQLRKPKADRLKSGDGSFVVGFFGKRFNDEGGLKFDNGGAIATIGLVLWAKE
jgi:hypothetical protein